MVPIKAACFKLKLPISEVFSHIIFQWVFERVCFEAKCDAFFKAWSLMVFQRPKLFLFEPIFFIHYRVEIKDFYSKNDFTDSLFCTFSKLVN